MRTVGESITTSPTKVLQTGKSDGPAQTGEWRIFEDISESQP
jgi:hypothetical protein